MSYLKWVVAACLVVVAPPALAQTSVAGPEKVASEAPEHDSGNEGILRHGGKFGVSIGMPAADAEHILLARNGVFKGNALCAGRSADADCLHADLRRTYEIDRHSVLTVPLSRYVTVSIVGGKVSQIHWWPKPFDL